MSGNANDPSSWAPPNESPLDLWTERSNFVSVPLSSVAYGIHLTLYLIVSHHLIFHPSSSSKRHLSPSWPLIIYISINFILGSFGIAAESRFNQLTFVDDRNYPGGPNAFVNAQYGDFINIFGTASYVVLNWLADGLVIYRFWLIYSFNYCVLILPTGLLLASISMGIILLFQLTQPSANLWSHTTVNFSLPYFSISISLNILVTSLIVLRLLYIRRQTRRALTSAHAKTYTSIMAMLVESAAIYSVTAIIFIVTYARGNNVQNLVLPVLGQVQAISPLLIMWRVALGQAWTRDTWSVTTSKLGAHGSGGGGMHTGSKISWNRNAFTARSGYANTGMTTTNTNGTDIDIDIDGELLTSSSMGGSTSNVNGIPVPSLPMSARHRYHHTHTLNRPRKLSYLDEKRGTVGNGENENENENENGLDEDIEIDLDERVSDGHNRGNGRWDVNGVNVIVHTSTDVDDDRVRQHHRDRRDPDPDPDRRIINAHPPAQSKSKSKLTTLPPPLPSSPQRQRERQRERQQEKDQLSTTSGISGVSSTSSTTIDIEKDADVDADADAEVMALEWMHNRRHQRSHDELGVIARAV